MIGFGFVDDYQRQQRLKRGVFDGTLPALFVRPELGFGCGFEGVALGARNLLHGESLPEVFVLQSRLAVTLSAGRYAPLPPPGGVS